MNATPQSLAEKKLRPFGIRDKIGYMFGDFGNDFSFILQMMFFMKFYTDVMGINPSHVGVLFLGARLLDAFTDVGMGRLVDMLKPTAAGRFRPWILRMAIPVSLASLMMYMPLVVDASYGVRLTYMCVTYVIWGSIFYTSINIPYGSMAAVVSDKPEHRTSLSVFRSVGAQLANLVISSALPPLVSVDNHIDSTRMMIAAIVCAVCGVGCYLACYANVQERMTAVLDEEPKEKVSFGKMLSTLVHNRPLLSLVLGAIFFLLGSQVVGTVTTYLWQDYFKDFAMMSVAQIVSVAPVFLISVVATALSMRFGKKEILVTLLLFSALLSILTYYLHLTSIPFFIVLFFFISIGVGFYNVIVWAMITDVLDFQEVLTGERDDGVVYAIYSWSRKLGQALAGWLVGLALAGIGYDAEIAKAKGVQAQETIDGIYMLFLLVPGVLYLLCALVMWFLYPLSKKRVMENYRTLKSRHDVAVEEAVEQ